MKTMLTKSATVVACAALSAIGITACAPPPSNDEMNVVTLTWKDATTGESIVSAEPEFTIPAKRAGTMYLTTDLALGATSQCLLTWQGSWVMELGLQDVDGKATFIHKVDKPGMKRGHEKAHLECVAEGSDKYARHWSTSFRITVERAQPDPDDPEVTLDPARVDFGSAEISTVGPSRDITVTNISSEEVPLAPVPYTLVGDESNFRISHIDGAGCSRARLQPGASCRVTATFTPRSVGTQSAGFRLFGPVSSPATVELSGIGTAPSVPRPAFAASPSPLDFGNTQVLFGRTADLTVINTGTADLVFGAGAVQVTRNATAFAVTDDRCSSTTLAPGGTCTVQMYFRPGAEGPDSGEVQFSDNADNSPQTVTMTGIGIPFAGVS